MANSYGQFTLWVNVSYLLKSEPNCTSHKPRASFQRWQVHRGLQHGKCPHAATQSLYIQYTHIHIPRYQGEWRSSSYVVHFNALFHSWYFILLIFNTCSLLFLMILPIMFCVGIALSFWNRKDRLWMSVLRSFMGHFARANCSLPQKTLSILQKSAQHNILHFTDSFIDWV